MPAPITTACLPIFLADIALADIAPLLIHAALPPMRGTNPLRRDFSTDKSCYDCSVAMLWSAAEEAGGSRRALHGPGPLVSYSRRESAPALAPRPIATPDSLERPIWALRITS